MCAQRSSASSSLHVSSISCTSTKDPRRQIRLFCPRPLSNSSNLTRNELELWVSHASNVIHRGGLMTWSALHAFTRTCKGSRQLFSFSEVCYRVPVPGPRRHFGRRGREQPGSCLGTFLVFKHSDFVTSAAHRLRKKFLDERESPFGDLFLSPFDARLMFTFLPLRSGGQSAFQRPGAMRNE